MGRLFILILLCLSTVMFSQETQDLAGKFSCKACGFSAIQKKLSDEYGLRFSYASSTLAEIELDLRFSFDNQSINDVLTELFAQQDIDVKIIENNVMLRPSTSLSGSDDLSSEQESIWLKGRVSGLTSNGASLPAATIMIKGSTRGTFASNNGNFEIEVPRSLLKDTLEISYMGYESSEYKIADIKDEYLMVSLKQSDYMVTEIVVMNSAKPIRVIDEEMAIQLTDAYLLNSTGLIVSQDINRSIQLLPGIAAHLDNDASIRIRGGGSDATFMVLDGMPIYNAGHYFGVLSSVNASYIDSVNVYRNLYPINFKGGSAGLIEYVSQRDIAPKNKVKLDVDLLTASAVVKLPVGRRSFINLAGRSTIRPISNDLFFIAQNSQSLELVEDEFNEDLGVVSSNPSCDFYDVNASYIWNNEDKTLFSLHYFKSNDNYINPFSVTVKDRRNNEMDVNINELKSWTNSSFGLELKQKLSNKIDLLWRSHLTDYSNTESNKIIIDKRFNGPEGPPPKNPNGVMLGAMQQNELIDYGAMMAIEGQLLKGQVDLGLVSERKEIIYSFEENNERILDREDKFTSLESFARYRYTTQGLSTDLGVRWSYYDHLDESYWSPRLSLQYVIKPSFLLKSSWSRVPQVVRQLYFEYLGVPNQLWIAANNEDIAVLSSDNLMLGSTVSFDHVTLDVEAYYKKIKGVLEYSVINPAKAENNPEKAQDYRLFNGGGRVLGIDFMLSTGYRNFDTYIVYTISENLERNKQINNGQYYPSEYDRKHQFKWLNTIRYGDFILGLNSILASGRVFTNIGNIGSDQMITRIDAEDRFDRLPYYHRVDLSLSYDFLLFSKPCKVNAGVFNLFNRQNLNYQQSVTTNLQANNEAINSVIGNQAGLLNRTLNLGFSISL